MATFLEAVTSAVRGGVCNVLSNPLVDGRQWGPRPPFVGDGVATNPLTTRWYNNTIDGLRSMFCDAPAEQEDPGERFPIPFAGGQCELVYQYVVKVQTQSGNGTINANGKTWGPITGYRVVKGAGSVQGFVTSRSPTTAQFCGIPAGSIGPLQERQIFNVASSQTFTTDSFELIGPCSGQDNCGNIPPVYNPINVFNFTTNIEYTDNSNNTYNELGDFNLFAPVFLPGSVTIPFNLSLGGVEFSGDLFPNGTINLKPGFEFNIGSPRDPGSTENFDEPPDPEFEQEPSEEQEAEIVGAWVFITTDPSRATGLMENGVTHLYPRAGILKWKIAGGVGGYVYSEGQDLKTRRTWVPIPRSGRVIGADFFGYYGSKGRVILAYAKVPEGLFPS